MAIPTLLLRRSGMDNDGIFRITNKYLDAYSKKQKSIFFSKADCGSHRGGTLQKKQYTADLRQIRTIWLYHFQTLPVVVERFHTSSLHRVYQVIDSRKDARVIRISSCKNRDFSLLIEEEIQHILREKKICTPRTYVTDISRMHASFDYQINACAVGTNLHDLARYGKIPQGIHRALGRDIARMHSIQSKCFGKFDAKEIIVHNRLYGISKTWGSYLYTNLEKHIALCIRSGILQNQDGVAVKRIFSKLKHSISAPKPSLLHGDLANHNIFANGSAVSAVIDFEDSVAGDPLFDIAYWGTGSFWNSDWLFSFLKGYRDIRRIPEKLPTRYWLYFLRISLAKSVARYNFGFTDTTQKKNFRDRIIYTIKKMSI